MTIAIRGAALPATLLAAPIAATSALAHVTLKVQQAPANANHKAVFRVPHGRDGAATTRITVRLPEGVRQARPMPEAGWRLTSEPREDAPAPGGHGATPEVAAVTWEGGPLDDDHDDEFAVRFRTPDAPGTTPWIPVEQGCEGGRAVSWSWVPGEGQRVSDHPTPAAALRLAPRG